jgi:integrase
VREMRVEGVLKPLKNLVKRGEILCSKAKCGRSRTEAVCPHCGHVHCMIRLYWKGLPYRFYSAKWGRPFQFEDAWEVLQKMNKEIKDGEFDPENWTKKTAEKKKFRALWERWIAEKQEEVKNEAFSWATLKAYETYYRTHLNRMDEDDVREITDEKIIEFKDSLPMTLSGKYRKNIVDCLRSFFGWLKKKKKIAVIPDFPEMNLPKTKKRSALSYGAQFDFIALLPLGHRPIHIFMRELALRVAEVCAVKILDLDIEGERILIQRTYSAYRLVETTKQREADWIPLSDVALEIAEFLSAGRFRGDFLFINPDTGRPYKTNYLRKLWKKYGKPEFPHLTLYEAMRVSTITDWGRSGANAFQIQACARHRDIRTSEKYFRDACEGLRPVINRQNVVHIDRSSRASRQAVRKVAWREE